MIIFISNDQDRRTVAGILVSNGYTVSVKKVKVGKKAQTKTALSIEEAEKGVQDEQR